MAAIKYKDMAVRQIRKDVERRLAYTDNLMVVIFDLNDGPQSEPAPPHSHPHEQISYVAEGELYFLMDGQKTRLGPGDVFVVPSGKPHHIQLITERVRLVDCFTPLREDFLEDS